MMTKHKPDGIRYSKLDKERWFLGEVASLTPRGGFKSDIEISKCIAVVRNKFYLAFKRQVSGEFIKGIGERLGQTRKDSAKTVLKRRYMFRMMNQNMALRENRTQMRKLLNDYFAEETHTAIFDDLWDQYHNMKSHPKPIKNVDAYGQAAIFES
jgi:hypothetical protein